MQALREKVLIAIKTTYTLDWTTIIEINLETSTPSSQFGARFSITKERKYVTHHSDFGYRQVHWTATPDGRLPHSRPFPWKAEDEFIVPTGIESYGKQTTYLPYSDELWEQLEEIEKYLLLAVRRLRHDGFYSPEAVSATLTTCRMLFDRFANHDEKTGEE